jgi:hypothetical protein
MFWGHFMPNGSSSKVTVTNAGITYLGAGAVLGFVVGIITFIVAYIYCIATYGFLFGLGLGWLPAGILAGIVGWATVFLWGAVLALAVLGALVLISFLWPGAVVYAIWGGAIGLFVWWIAPKFLKGR